MQDFLANLNEKQLDAVKEKNGPILVLAGAGSGKTKVLTTRIVRLIKDGISPNDILAVTFTNKAAKEMQTRLSKYIGENIVKRMWVGTFHNICGRILRNDIENYKTKDGRSWQKNYVIYDDTDTKTVIKNALKKLNMDEKVYDYKNIKSIISNAKNKMQDAYTFATYAKDHFSEKVSQVYYEYEKELVNNNAIDFDDMLMLSVNLLKTNPEIKEKYEKRFKHILVDEFQDTNKAQSDLIKLFYPNDGKKDNIGSLCCVGDVDQSIYSWRGADFKIILNFQDDYKNVKLIKLEQNYRSTGNILNAANEVIKNNEERLEKNLYSNKGTGEKITLYEAKDDYVESRYIAKKIEELRNYNNIAILYRTNAQSRSLEEALITYSIPYKIIGGLKFYDRKEIKDTLAYLKLIYNHNDSASLKRIINVPKRKIGDTTLKKLSSWADENEVSLFEAIKNVDKIEEISSKTKDILKNFNALIEELTSSISNYELSEFISVMLEKAGYLQELRAEDNVENQSRLENIEEFVNVVKEFETDEFNLEQIENQSDSMLGNFLSQIALVSDVDEIKDDLNSVTLMTLHSAKGLEYPIIFLTGLEDGLFPHVKTMGINSYSNQSELEEERRLMYVGITRAKEKLYLTYSKSRKVWGHYQNNPKSRFLDEIPIELIEYDNEEINSYGKSSFSSTVDRIKKLSKNADNYQNNETKPTNSLLSSIERIKKSAQKAKENQEKEGQAKENQETNKIDYKRINAKVIKKDKNEGNKNLSVADLIAKAKEKAKSPANLNLNRKLRMYPIGTRVFHRTFGIGKIKEILEQEGISSYVVDFTKAGEKTLDSMTSDLKTF